MRQGRVGGYASGRLAGMLLAGLVLLLGGGPGMATESRCREISTAERVGLENGRVSLAFDRASGALVSLRNLATGDEYLQDPGGVGNPFVVFWGMSQPFTPGADVAALGGQRLEPKDCHLEQATFERQGRGGHLELRLRTPAPNLRLTLAVWLPDDDVALDCRLTARNSGAQPQPLMASFPYLSGLGLGENRETNLAVDNAQTGGAGSPAWIETGGRYGDSSQTMQWQAVYEPSRDEGLGLIVLDPGFGSKWMRRHTSGLEIGYFPPVPVAVGGEFAYPPARLIVHQGNWRIVADRHREWFGSVVKLRHPPAWLDEMDLLGAGHVPGAAAVAQAKENPAAPGAFADFRQLPRLYLEDPNPYDSKEWAMYNTAALIPGGFYDGLYYPREDLGGPAALREGVAAAHRIGRRVTLYVQGMFVQEKSELSQQGIGERWAVSPEYQIYADAWTMCPGCVEWQDHLAQTCARLLRETGADGIRLDSVGYLYGECTNPAHHHADPFAWNQWTRELLRKVRAAMDAVDPQSTLWTEAEVDYYAESCNGALSQYPAGAEAMPMRVALPPTFRILDYGAGNRASAGEAALQGLGAWSHYLFLKQDWTWVAGPYGIWTDAGPVTRWPELHASFREAMNYGYPTHTDPRAEGDPAWQGRLWTTPQYWLLVGGHLDGTPLAGPTRVKLPELPAGVKQGYEFDFLTLHRKPAVLERTAEGVFVTVQDGFSAVLLPLADCPPLVEMRDLPSLRPGAKVHLRLEAVAPWQGASGSHQVRVSAPGLRLPEGETVTLPGEVSLEVPADAEPGAYPLTVTGDCLPLKRWVQVR